MGDTVLQIFRELFGVRAERPDGSFFPADANKRITAALGENSAHLLDSERQRFDCILSFSPLIRVASLILLATSQIWAKDIPTETRVEHVTNVEVGALTEPNEINPSGWLYTVKTDKGLYYALEYTNPEVPTVTASDAILPISQGKSVIEKSPSACLLLHLLFPLRPDGTPDNPQANATFYPDKEHRSAFNSPDWSEETYPRFRGIFLGSKPTTLNGKPVTYSRKYSVDSQTFCIIESQHEKPELNPNPFLDGRVSYTPPLGMQSESGGGDDGDPFGTGTITVKAYSNEQKWDSLTRVIFYITSAGVEIGEGKIRIYTPVKFGDLQPLIEDEFKEQLVAGTMNIERTKLSGYDAYNVTGTLKQQAAPNTSNLSEFWIILEPHAILRVSVQAKDRHRLEDAVESLKTLRIDGHADQPEAK